MYTPRSILARSLILAVAALTTVAMTAVGTATSAAAGGSGGPPVVKTQLGRVRGVAIGGGYAFRGVPYAAPPTGNLRWRPPQPAHGWDGVREATSSRRAVPSRAAHSLHLAHSTRTASTSTCTPRRSDTGTGRGGPC